MYVLVSLQNITITNTQNSFYMGPYENLNLLTLCFWSHWDSITFRHSRFLVAQVCVCMWNGDTSMQDLMCINMLRLILLNQPGSLAFPTPCKFMHLKSAQGLIGFWSLNSTWQIRL